MQLKIIAEVDLRQWDNDQSYLEGVTNCKMLIHFIFYLQHSILKNLFTFHAEG